MNIDIVQLIPYGFAAIMAFLMVMRDRQHEREVRRLSIQNNQLLDRVMCRDFGQYQSARMDERNAGSRQEELNDYPRDDDEVSMDFQAFGEDLVDRLSGNG